MCILLCLFSGFFFWWFLGLNLHLWDWKTKHWAWDVLEKLTFTEVGILMILGSIFYDFECPWEQFWWLLLPWRLAWNLLSFQNVSGVTPDPATLRVGGKLVGSRALVTTTPGSLKPTLEILRPKWESWDWAEVPRTNDTLETGLQMMLRSGSCPPRSLVSPNTGAGAGVEIGMLRRGGIPFVVSKNKIQVFKFL